MKFCRDCKFYNGGNCHLGEFNIITGVQATKESFKAADIARNNNMNTSCGIKAQFFTPGIYKSNVPVARVIKEEVKKPVVPKAKKVVKKKAKK